MAVKREQKINTKIVHTRRWRRRRRQRRWHCLYVCAMRRYATWCITLYDVTTPLVVFIKWYNNYKKKKSKNVWTSFKIHVASLLQFALVNLLKCLGSIFDATQSGGFCVRACRPHTHTIYNAGIHAETKHHQIEVKGHIKSVFLFAAVGLSTKAYARRPPTLVPVVNTLSADARHPVWYCLEHKIISFTWRSWLRWYFRGTAKHHTA